MRYEFQATCYAATQPALDAIETWAKANTGWPGVDPSKPKVIHQSSRTPTDTFLLLSGTFTTRGSVDTVFDGIVAAFTGFNVVAPTVIALTVVDDAGAVADSRRWTP